MHTLRGYWLAPMHCGSTGGCWQMSGCLFCGGTGKENPHRRDNHDPLDRAINESHRYQALLFQAWRALRGQTKGLQRQRRLIKRLQAENARLRNNMEWVRTMAAADKSGVSKP